MTALADLGARMNYSLLKAASHPAEMVAAAAALWQTYDTQLRLRWSEGQSAERSDTLPRVGKWFRPNLTVLT